MRFFQISVALAVLVLFSACKDKAKEQRRESLRELMHGNTADPDIAAAMEKARASVGDFLSALQKPAGNQRQFMVRKSFPTQDPAKRQILWVNDVSTDGTNLRGRVDDNTAQQGSGLAKDGVVSFPASEIADWMYNEDGKAVGGFMLRALKSKMTEQEWDGIARQMQFKE